MMRDPSDLLKLRMRGSSFLGGLLWLWACGTGRSSAANRFGAFSSEKDSYEISILSTCVPPPSRSVPLTFVLPVESEMLSPFAYERGLANFVLNGFSTTPSCCGRPQTLYVALYELIDIHIFSWGLSDSLTMAIADLDAACYRARIGRKNWEGPGYNPGYGLQCAILDTEVRIMQSVYFLFSLCQAITSI